MKQRLIEVFYEPGNATRYHLLYRKPHPAAHSVNVTLPAIKGILCWLREGGSGGTCFVFDGSGSVSLGYLMEKMKVNSADGAALITFLQDQGVDAWAAGEPAPTVDAEFIKERATVLEEIGKGAKDFTCPTCQGEGIIEWFDDHSTLPHSTDCATCHGERTIDRQAICEQYDIEYLGDSDE